MVAVPTGDTPGVAASGESRLKTLARELIATVGVEGAARYCRSLGWRGVLDEVELLRAEKAAAE